MSEIRYDRLFDRDVIIAPERLHRPSTQEQKYERRSSQRVCPFCEGNERLTPPEIFALRESESFANEPGWQTRVVANLFKALQIEAPHTHHYGHFEHWEGFGAHEILIDTPQHHTSMTEWSQKNAYNWFTTIQQRVNDLRHDSRIASLSIFKNEGREAGGTQPHSHTQLIGMPLIAKEKRQQYELFFRHYKEHGEALLANILREELSANERIVGQEGAFVAYCPYASSYPFEVIISSEEGLGELHELSLNDVNSLTKLLLDTLKKIKHQLSAFEFNLILATPPLHPQTLGEELFYSLKETSRFYIRIIPRVYKYGGFEHESGIYINPLSPERAAKLLKGEESV